MSLHEKKIILIASAILITAVLLVFNFPFTITRSISALEISLSYDNYFLEREIFLKGTYHLNLFSPDVFSGEIKVSGYESDYKEYDMVDCEISTKGYPMYLQLMEVNMKNRIIILIFILILISVLCTSCKNNTTNSEDNSLSFNSNTQEIDNNESSSNSNSQRIPTSEYKINKPLIESNNYFEISELVLPQNINDMKMAIYNIIKESNLLVALYTEDPTPVIKEIGVYDWENNQYKTYVAFTENKTISIQCSNDNLIIYEEIDYSTNKASLYYFDIQQNQNVKIYDFSYKYVNPFSLDSYYKSTVYDNKIYFYDVLTTNNEISGVELLEYDLKTGKTVSHKKYSQNPSFLSENPILFNDKLIYISNDENTNSYYLESNYLPNKISLNKGISSLTSANDQLYCINNNEFDEKRLFPIWSINSLVNEEELLTASFAIDNLVANDYIVAWENFFPEKPLVYLRKKDSFLVLIDDKKAYNSYWLADNYGILIRRYDKAPTKYFIFKYVQ